MINSPYSNLLPVPTGLLEVSEQPGEPISGLANGATDQNQLKPWFSLIVPTYNEAANVTSLVAILCDLMEEATNGCYELIIVDDNSPDFTWKKAQELAEQYSHLRVMRRVEERGLSTAVIRGWQAAQGEILGVIDGDLQHPPETLLTMLKEIHNGADLVVASRHLESGGVSDWSPMRRLLSRGAQILGLIVCPAVVGRVTDPMSGYFLVRRSAIAKTVMNPRGYKILLEVIGRCSIHKITEVGYVFKERVEGESKVTWRQYVDYIIHLAKLRSRGRITRLRIRSKTPIKRFLRFAIVGSSGVFVDMGLLFLLSDPTMFGWGLTRSKMLAAEIAIVNNFIWNDLWTFGDIARKQKGWKFRIKRFLKFNYICLMGLILNILLLNILFNDLGVNRYIANLIAILIVTIWNFWINLKLSWRSTNVK